MTDGQWRAALLTSERRDAEQDILPEWALGGCGWTVALAPDVETARGLLVRDMEYHGLRIIKIDEEREVFTDDGIEGVDGHLAMNFREIEPGKQMVWGTIHCYNGEGAA